MKKHLLCLLAMIAPMIMSAQDEVETTIGADIVSQYIWRGQELGDVSLQPTLGIAYKGLSLTAWGSIGLSNKDNTKEFDLTAAYATGGFHIGVTDYWFNTPNERYFAYSAHETSHVFEANVGYDFEIASLNWYTNFAGNDGVNKDGKRAYSSYFEANVPFKLAACKWTATIGAVPYATSFYSDANGFVVTNIGIKATKDIKVNDHFSIPIFAGITANPSTEKTFFIFGVSL
ncbi:MAG: hypothetical protein E7104_10620 [Prevotella sp.]|nr:hypothetical protein [Prevotella sp.]